MYCTERLIYLELQKTGGTHVRTVLDRVTGGSVHGKHNRLEEAGGRYVIGSIRNPWDWYVSLWAYGAGGKGAIRHRTTRGFHAAYYLNQLPREMGRRNLNPWQALQMVGNDLCKPTARWLSCYQDHEDPQRFRDWLTMLLDHERRFDIGEGYAFSPLAAHAGILTYRYFRLYTIGDAIYRDQLLSSKDGIAAFDAEHNCADKVLRTDRLIEDLIEALHASGTELDDEQIDALRKSDGERTNASARRPASYYYDADTIALVAERDAYLIDKYGFAPPLIDG